MWRGHGLPEEDGVFDEGAAAAATGVVHITIAVIAGPHISNLDEFQPLKNVPGVRLVWARSPAALVGADWVVLPGSKRTPGDLAWLRKLGLDCAIAEHAARGGRVLGICGGLQMLGEALIDPFGLESSASDDLSAAGSATRAALFESTGPGLGLLPLVTVFDREKNRARLQRHSLRHAGSALGARSPAWRCGATRSTTVAPPCIRRWSQPATAPAKCCPAGSDGRAPARTCSASMCTACSRTPLCCRRFSVPRHRHSTPFSTALRGAWRRTSKMGVLEGLLRPRLNGR